MAAKRKIVKWTREHMLIALNLYFQTPFGKQHSGYPPIVALAKKMGRTPGSLAMKLNNFTSLDPIESARGIAGLTGASKKDREIWKEFTEATNELAAESEELLENLVGAEAEQIEIAPPSNGATEKTAPQKVRLQQRYFRRVVLASYDSRCCISGLPVPTLLRASHIVPWAESEEHRLNPNNGLCLAATYDAAFDRGLISFDGNLQLILGDELEAGGSDDEVEKVFGSRKGQQLTLPSKNCPGEELLAAHREKWGFS